MDAEKLNVLNLAFLGDSVWSVKAREYVLTCTSCKLNELHKLANKFVCASSQAIVYDKIFESLSEEEKKIATRARNAKKGTIPKSASKADYSKSTSLEAVIGYNFLIGNQERINNFFSAAKQIILNEGK